VVHFSLSPEAVEFLVKHIGFVERLEILVFLQRRVDIW
jgi:hypothetical protein